MNKLAEAMAIIDRAESELREMLGHGGWVVRLDIFGNYLNQAQADQYTREAKALGWNKQQAQAGGGQIEYYEMGADGDGTQAGKSEFIFFNRGPLS